MTPQLGLNTQIQRTALIAPGRTQGSSTIERSAVDAEEVAQEEERRQAVPRTTTERRRAERKEKRILECR